MRPGLLPGADLEGVISTVAEIQDILRGRVGFGHPAGTLTRLDNMRGAWVTVDFEATDTATTITHNLDVPVPASGLNVRWWAMRVEHSGAGAAGASTMSISHETGDAIAVNSFELRLYAEATRTIAAGANAVAVDFFVIPATD